jgi:two-component system, OmpR family, phosphate regulon response regulator PhoB
VTRAWHRRNLPVTRPAARHPGAAFRGRRGHDPFGALDIFAAGTRSSRQSHTLSLTSGSVVMSRILVIEDEPDIRQVLDYNLRLAGHEVSTAARGLDGLRLVREHSPELVILDLMLPDIPGTEVCRTIKDNPETRLLPVLILTARDEEIDKVVGFELGADDYITKPFSVRELVLRVRAVLRRKAPPGNELPSIEFGNLRIDRAAHRVWVESVEVELTALELKLLVVLYDRRNRVQSREALLEHVWGIESRISTRTVDAHVKRLREKIGVARGYIETVRGVGYRFADTALVEAS